MLKELPHGRANSLQKIPNANAACPYDIRGIPKKIEPQSCTGAL